MKKFQILLTGLFAFTVVSAMAQGGGSNTILLWPKGAPGSEGHTTLERVSKSARGEISISNVNFPSITPYLPKPGKGNGLAIVVGPGGGDKELKMDYEGSNFAEWLAERGVAAFVLKYRLAKEANSVYTVQDHALKDMQRAIRLVRSRAKEWGIDTGRVGAMGFSAGGELAGLAAMKFDYGDKNASDIIEKQSSRPNLQLLLYPGGSAAMEPVKGSPPLFMVVGDQDDQQRCIDMAELYIKYRKANIPVEFHVFTKAVHGFGIRTTTAGAVADWPNRFYAWLDDMDFLKPAGALKTIK